MFINLLNNNRYVRGWISIKESERNLQTDFSGKRVIPSFFRQRPNSFIECYDMNNVKEITLLPWGKRDKAEFDHIVEAITWLCNHVLRIKH